MLNGDQVLCACFAILPLEDTFMGQFIKGRLDDHQIDGDDILDPVSAKACKRLYISGVIVRDHLGYVGRKRANVMIWAMLNYIKAIYGLKRQRTLYAVSITKESERLMKNLGFSLVSDGAERKDHCKLFSYLLSKDSWDLMHVTVGDWSGICECRFK
jgi:hypothetical protein